MCELRVRQGHAPGPWPPSATSGDVQLSQTLKGLSAREREVSPTPFIPTRRVIVRHSPCTPWQPIRLGPKRGLPSLDTPRQGPLAVYSCTLSRVSDGLEMREIEGQQTAISGHWSVTQRTPAPRWKQVLAPTTTTEALSKSAVPTTFDCS